MDRETAMAVIQPHVVKVEQYEAVPISTVAKLLGEELFGRLKRDRIRFLGPDSAHIYPWNVADYLMKVAESVS
jgi:hypothetical protein